MLLSLQLIADGIAIDTFTLLKLKLHLVEIMDFSDIAAIPSHHGQPFYVQFGEVEEIPEIALPCVGELLQVLDSSHTVESTPSGGSHDGKGNPTLVGSAFVDVSLAIFSSVKETMALPTLTVKSMLEALCIIIYKHDFENIALRHLQPNLRKAVVGSLHLMLQDVSYELRQLALSVAQAFVKRWNSIMGSTVQ